MAAGSSEGGPQNAGSGSSAPGVTGASSAALLRPLRRRLPRPFPGCRGESDQGGPACRRRPLFRAEAYTEAGDLASQQGTWQFGGRFRGTDLARGTVRFRFTLRLSDGRSFQCDSGVVRWTVRDPLRAPGSGALRRSGAYVGHSAKPAPLPRFAPLLLRVSRDGRRVTTVAFVQTVRCRDNREHTVDPALMKSRVSRRGRSFGGPASYTNSSGAVASPNRCK